MLIKSILAPNRTRAHIEGNSKKRLLETIARIFAESETQLDVDSVYQSLIGRERLGTTGIGGGIAIPHCRFDTNGNTYGACITLKTPIDFDAVDNEPVDIIFAMLVPENAEKSHLEFLAGLAETLQAPNFVSGLRSAATDDELFQLATSST